MRYWITGFIFLALTLSALSWADTVADVAPANQITVSVTDRSAPALQLALQSAFSEVLAKMSGNPEIMMTPAFQKASANLTQWVQSYAYIDSSNTGALQLQVVFDKSGLQQLLQTATPSTAQTHQLGTLSETTVNVVISGVKTVEDYVQLTQALRQKNDVAAVSVDNVHGDVVSLVIKVVGNALQLQQVLSSDNHFKLMASQPGNTQLLYYWTGNQAQNG